ncbi:MAG TPA: hypothetical protein VMR23_10865 [Candidatus Limnocylindria bacterium]|nr:hypothetical protein [Candidatus Limnocylindria bacterium]
MTKRATAVSVLVSALLWCAAASAEPVAVRYAEGVTRAFPVLRSVTGERLAQGDLVQIARGDRVESRMVFKFRDGSLYDETVVFSQRDVFVLESYRLVQRGPAFPESMDAFVDRETGRYTVWYKADEESAEELLTGKFELPMDAYNGLLTTLMKNLPTGESVTVQIVAFTPKPRLVKMLLAPTVQDPVMVGETAMTATRFMIKPQLGLFASLLIADLPDVKCWIVEGAAPAFIKFEGPLYFMGPVWRIEWV